MDTASTEAAFALVSADDELVAGEFSWEEGDRILVFQPSQPLEYGTSYRIEVSTDARSASGEGHLRQELKVGFRTAYIISFVDSVPADGVQDVPPEDNLEIKFRGVVDEKTLGKGSFTILPEPTDVYTYFSSYDGRWMITWPMQPRTAYTVTLSGKISDIFGNTLGDDVVIRFRTGDRRPFAHLNLPNGDIGTYNAYNDTEVAASYRNVSSLDFKLYEVSEADATRMLGPDRWQAMQNYRPKAERLVREWSVPVEPVLNTNNLLKVPLAEDGGPLAAGVYWIEMRAPEVKYSSNGDHQEVPRHLLIVSPLNLVVKKGYNEMLVWATDLQSGQPVAGLPVRVNDNSAATGVTDDDGIARMDISVQDPWEPLIVFGGEAGSETYGIASTDWTNGISPWEFGLNYEMPPPEWQGYAYTDRPLYRPGQTVYWKLIMRADDDAIYSVPPEGTKMEVVINDNMGNQVYKEIHTTNEFGTIHGALPLADEAGLGYYSIQAQFTDQKPNAYYQPFFGVGFQVAEYRKPEYEVSLETDRDEYLQGETIAATVSADFFFGGSVSNAKVQWSVFSQDTGFSYNGPQDGLWYSFYDYTGWDPRDQPRNGGPLTSGEGKTDAQGRFTFEIPADIGDRTQSQLFLIDARIIDLNNQEVATNTSVIVHKGLVYPGLASRSYVAEIGQPNLVDVITVDWDSQPVPDQEVTLVVNKAKWNTVQEKADNGQFYWVTRVEETPILTEKVTTDADGKAVFSWTPDAGGQYKINAIVTDSKGNDVQSSLFVWVSDQPETLRELAGGQ